jgi:hypothetical protein
MSFFIECLHGKAGCSIHLILKTKRKQSAKIISKITVMLGSGWLKRQ